MFRTSPISRFQILALVTVIAVGGTPAFAVDGVKLIGKRATYPIVISQPGSYRLRSNITLPTSDATAIHITAPDVTLDLNGFAITGPVTCDANTHVCSGSNPASAGIDSDSSNGVVVRNGSVRGVGGHGIRLNGGRVENVRVSNNGGNGVLIQGDSVARADGVEAYNNLYAGIVVAGGLVTNCVANNNGENGIYVYQGGVVVNSVAKANQDTGVYVDAEPAVAVGNYLGYNGQGGLRGTGIAIANVISENGGDAGLSSVGAVTIANYAAGNVNDGLAVEAGPIIGNYAAGNGQNGIYADGPAGMAFNVAGDNLASGQILSGIELGPNLCDGGLTCPAP